MTDKKVPNPKYVAFSVKSQPHELRLVKDFNHICMAEAQSGCNLFRAMLGGGMSAQETRALLYSCLLEWNPNATLQESGDLIQGAWEDDELGIVLKALGEVLSLSEPEPEEEPETPKAEGAPAA